MKIVSKLVLILGILIVTSIAISGVAYYLSAVQTIEKRIEAQLESVSVLKENQLNDFIGGAAHEIEGLAKEKSLTDNFIEMQKANAAMADVNIYHENIKQLLKERQAHTEEFFELFIIDMNRKVSMSTDRTQEGKFKSGEPYFIKGKEETFVQHFYYDSSLQQPAITISTPIKDSSAGTIGILVGRFNLSKISDIMVERSGLGKTGETYLVNKLSLIVSKSRFVEGIEYKETIHSDAAKSCLKGNIGYGQYDSYRDVPVVGFYTWIPQREICLIAEMEQSEALAPVWEMMFSLTLVSLGIIALTTFIGIILSRTVTKPILKLKNAVIEIGKGNLDTKIDIKSRNEIGELASTFNQMALDLKKSHEQIKRHAEELEQKVQERTAELDSKLKELETSRMAVMNMMEDVDISNKDLVEAQGKLKKSFTELKKLDQEKDTFISIAAHELKTPMTAIHGFAQLLENENVIKDAEARSKYLKIIEHEVNRLAKMVTEVLDLSRVDLGTIKFAIEDVNVNEIVDEVEAELTEKAKAKGLYLKFKKEKGLPLVQTDKERLKQILINLVDNSIKYSEKGGTTVEAVKDGDFLKISVSDKGIGIPKKHFNKMFTRFYQIENPLTRKVGGSGLGLSICKEFVEALGGKVWFKSRVGKGTNFFFTLPIKSKINPANKYQKPTA